jgi:hypothetical protein
MRLYPDLPAARTATILRDVAVLAALLVLALAGRAVHDAVDELAGLGRGVSEAGRSVQGGFSDAAGAVEGVPIVGGELGASLRSVGEGSGGQAAQLGREGEEGVHRLATLLGWLVFGIPAGLVLARYGPDRVRQARRLTDAAAVLDPAGAADPARRALLARRAAFGLPYGRLVRHTRDPLGDLEAGRHDALVAALLEHEGLRAPR